MSPKSTDRPPPSGTIEAPLLSPLRDLVGSQAARRLERESYRNARRTNRGAVRRTHILGHIEHAPGLHLRALQRSIAIPLDSLDYHLRVLERNGRVVIRTFNRYKAYYPSAGMDRRDRDLLYYMRHDLPVRVIIQILVAPGLSHKDLFGSLQIPSSTCEHHLKRLLDAGIVFSAQDHCLKRLYLRDPARVWDLVVRYEASFPPEVVQAVRATRPPAAAN